MSESTLSVYERYTLRVVRDIVEAGGRIDLRALAPHFPPNQEHLIEHALSQLAEHGLVAMRNGLVMGVSTAKGTMAELSNEFQAWWAEYPGRRRIKKAKCLEKYVRIRRKGVTREQMFDGLSRWKACKDWIKDNGDYIMAPEVWLNGGCWDDYPDGQPLINVLLPDTFQSRPWLATLQRFAEDPAKPRGWEMVNYAVALGLGQDAEQIQWVLRKDGPLAAAEWAWGRRAQ